MQELVQRGADNFDLAARNAPVDPILRWVGGKRWLLPALRELLSTNTFQDYHEPFLGGASVLLGLDGIGTAYAADSNHRLVSTYATIRDDPSSVASALARMPNEEASYYEIRREDPTDPIDSAAQFLYLNHTSFNGIYRVNAQGRYNVPYGRRQYLKVPNEEHLRAFGARLHGVHLASGDFEEALQRVNEGDLVFVDPPYATQQKTESFVRYNSTVFNFKDQTRLAESVKSAAKRGAKFILTNAFEESVINLFADAGKMVALRRPSLVGGSNASRRPVEELLVTNIPFGNQELLTREFGWRPVS